MDFFLLDVFPQGFFHKEMWVHLQIDPPCPALCVVNDCCSSVSNRKPDSGEYVLLLVNV